MLRDQNSESVTHRGYSIACFLILLCGCDIGWGWHARATVKMDSLSCPSTAVAASGSFELLNEAKRANPESITTRYQSANDSVLVTVTKKDPGFSSVEVYSGGIGTPTGEELGRARMLVDQAVDAISERCFRSAPQWSKECVANPGRLCSQ